MNPEAEFLRQCLKRADELVRQSDRFSTFSKPGWFLGIVLTVVATFIDNLPMGFTGTVLIWSAVALQHWSIRLLRKARLALDGRI